MLKTGMVIVLVIILAAAAAGAFSPLDAKWRLTDVSGHLPDLRFSLTDDKGKSVTAGDYRGEVVLLYFGFTGCSSQCPLTLARLSRLLWRLGSDAGRVRVLFVSINPANDAPPVLRRYLAPFGSSRMTGLTGSEKKIEALARRLRAAYRSDYAAGGDVPHSNAVYIFDASGRARLLAAPDDSDAAVIHDLRRLIHG